MGDLAEIVEADPHASGLPVDALVAASRKPHDYDTNRLNYPYIAGYASSALDQAAKGRSPQAEILDRACTVALLLCDQDTFDAIAAEATSRAVSA